MDKVKFIETLKSGTKDLDLMLECCNYFIEHYPSVVENQFTGQKYATKLIDEETNKSLVINGGSQKAIEFAFSGLVKNIKKLEEYELGTI